MTEEEPQEGVCAQANNIETPWKANVATIVDRYFSRKKEYWPFFGDPCFAPLVDFRLCHHPPVERVQRYPNGAALEQQLLHNSSLPHEPTEPPMQDARQNHNILTFAATLSKEREDPRAVANVGPLASDPAIYGSMLGSMVNANLVARRPSGLAYDLEQMVIRQVATLAGYEPSDATGLFTPGGTFCNLYGYLLGVRKNIPQTRLSGMEAVQNYRFIQSMGGHYSTITNLSVMGVNIKERIIGVKINHNNQMDLQDLEIQFRSCIKDNLIVPTIMVTMGTTDTFGVDDVGAVVRMRDELCSEFNLDYRPHVHVDAAVGWPILFFLNYNFDANPLGIPSFTTLAGLKRNADLFKGLRVADSFTVDFHKWGYVPLLSSLLMVRNIKDMDYLASDQDLFTYMEDHMRLESHLQSTLECSRGACGMFGAYAGLMYLGTRGYQILVANSIDNANYFRARLRDLGCVKLVAPENQGPQVGFRIYDPARVTDPDQEFELECQMEDSDEYRKFVERNTQFHRSLYLERADAGLFSSWVKFVAHTNYDNDRKSMKIPGEKAVFMSPRTTHKEIDNYVSELKKRLFVS